MTITLSWWVWPVLLIGLGILRAWRVMARYGDNAWDLSIPVLGPLLVCVGLGWLLHGIVPPEAAVGAGLMVEAETYGVERVGISKPTPTLRVDVYERM